ncbi:MAG: flagellar basal body P-ring formation chaperone FlgA [Steroidobacteraceae bacterium]
MRRFSDTLLYLCCLVAARIVLAAPELTPNDAIRAAARGEALRLVQSAVGRIVAEPAPLDPRLRLPRCAQPLETTAAALRLGQTRLNVTVSCTAGASWRINVPVDLAVEQSVLIVQAPIARSQAITTTQVRVEHRRVPGLAQRYVTDVGGLQHQVARRPLSVGEVITADVLTPEIIVKRGQRVTLLTDVAGISVRATGKALADAALDQRLRVENTTSQRIVEGKVVSADAVRILR